MEKNSIKRITIFVIIAGMLLSLTGIGLSYTLLTTFERTAQREFLGQTNSYKRRLHNQIQTELHMLSTMGSILGNSGLTESENLGELLHDAYDENEFLTVAFFDTNGNGVLSRDENILENAVPLTSIQPEMQQAALRALEGKETVSIFSSEDSPRQEIFCYGVPVYQEGQVIGALVGSNSIRALMESLEGEEGFAGNAYMHLLDANGNFLIPSSRSVVKEEKKTIFQEPYLGGEELSRVEKDLKDSGSSQFTFSHEGKRYQAMLVPFEENGWYLLTINSVQDRVSNLYRIIHVVAGFLILMVLLLCGMLLYGYRTIEKNSKRLMDLAYYDHLTGAYNLNHFKERIQDSVKLHPRYAVAAFDVRRFKFVNELFGKTEADKLLQYIAKVLSAYAGKNEFICRDTADTFYMYMADGKRERIEDRLRKIVETIEACSSAVNNDYRIKISCGVAIRDQQQNLQTVMTHMSFALKYVKKNPREHIWFFDSVLHEQEKLDNYIESNMQNALRAGDLKLYLQPKVDLSDHTLCGAEALTRWRKSDGSMIFPSQFIPIFEQTGFCVELDMYVVEKVCQLLRDWMDRGYQAIPISVNQSRLVFYEEEYVSHLRAILEK